MAKPQPIEVKSDDFTITVDGVEYQPHEGEAVWLFPGMPTGAILAANSLTQLQPQFEAADTPELAQEALTKLDAGMQKLLRVIAPRIVRWTWTDAAGRPLPQPDGTSGPLELLSEQEIGWLLQACKGETPSKRKNG